MSFFYGRANVSSSVLRGTAAAGVIALALTGAVFAQSYSFNSVSVSGNERIADATVLSYAGISRGQSLSAAELNDAAQRIRASGLFESVTVTPSGGTLVINVVERLSVNRVAFEGNRSIRDAQLASLVSSQSRRALDPARVQDDVVAISRAYADQGYVNAFVQPKIIRRSNGRADLVFEISEGGVTEIERIGFVGNRTFSDRRLRGVLQTKQAGLLRALISRDTYSPDRLQFDRKVLTEFYHSRGYMDFNITNVDVSLSEERDRYLVTFNVQEGQQFRVGQVNLVSEIPGVDTAPFARMLTLRSGAVYSPTDINRDIDRLEALALRRGVNFLRVEPRITRDARGLLLNVTYALTEGPRIFVERIDIEGNTTTMDRVIRNQFTVVEGDPFNPRQIRESAERIRALGFFSNAEVEAREGSSPDQVVVDVDVAEQPTGKFSFGGNYNPDVGFSLLANFKEQNFMGRGQYFALGVNAGRKSRRFSFDFIEPNLLGRDLSLGLSLAYASTNQQNAKYDTATGSFSPSIGFPVSENGRLNLTYEYDYTRLYGLPGAGDPPVSGIIRREAGLGGVSTHSLGYSYSWDSVRGGSTEDPWRVRFEFGQSFGRSDAQQEFVKTTGRLVAQTRVLNEDVVLRGVLQGGYLHYTKGNSRVTDRFFMGSEVMRGFQAGGIGPRDAVTGDALGGNAYAVARLEAEFPIGLPDEYGIHGGAFVDYGSLWDVGDTSGGTVLYNDPIPRAVAGLSLFWKTPVGPLRFNFSRPIKVESQDRTRNFDITISTNF